MCMCFRVCLSLVFVQYSICTWHKIIEINHMKFLLLGGRERIGLTSESSFYKNAERKQIVG